jgi:ribosomal protein S18 acetylase RimI-like enzyme
MRIRPFEARDLATLVDLTIETFRPFYEGHVRPLYGDELFRLHHGEWEQDYRDEVPTLHDPDAGRWIAVAEVGDAIAGYVAWKTGGRPNHGEIAMLAVAEGHRRRQAGRELCRYAIEEMKAHDVEVVGVFTGGDRFHAPARELYESLDFIKVPIVGYLKKV